MLLVGLIAGALAGRFVRGAGYGIIGDTLLGLVGALVGGWLFSLLGMTPSGNILYTILVAFVGAVLLVWLVGTITGGHKTVV